MPFQRLKNLFNKDVSTNLSDINEFSEVTMQQENNRSDNNSSPDIQKSHEQLLSEINTKINDIATNYVKNPEQIAELLAFGAKMYKYSAKNTMLIYNANPGATFVQSYEKWKDMGYSVKRGQKGIKIFVPRSLTFIKEPSTDEYIAYHNATPELKQLYKENKVEHYNKTYFTIGNVFDISQTNCPTEKYPEFFSMGYSDENIDCMIDGIKDFCNNRLNVSINETDMNSISRLGYYKDNTITLNNLMKSSQKLSTLSHELGHHIMDHSNIDSDKNIYQKEFEADCLSIMLDNHLGTVIPEHRKSHLADSFKLMKEEYFNKGISYEFSDIITDVFKQFSSCVKEIDKYINSYIDKKKELEVQDIEELNEDIDPMMFDKLYESPEYSLQHVEVAKSLPEDWHWIRYNDGTGYLYSPDNKPYFSYKLNPQANWIEYSEIPASKNYNDEFSIYIKPLADFKKFAENIVKDKYLETEMHKQIKNNSDILSEIANETSADFSSLYNNLYSEYDNSVSFEM